MSMIDHKKEAPNSVNCKVITVSDTRNEINDKSGKLMIDLLEKEGHKVIDYVIVKDEADSIKNEIIKGCENKKIEIILTNGGTGIAKRDVTIETVQPLIEKEIVGFGEF
jgi:molybdenum cofactor biosynthesis protein B